MQINLLVRMRLSHLILLISLRQFISAVKMQKLGLICDFNLVDFSGNKHPYVYIAYQRF